MQHIDIVQNPLDDYHGDPWVEVSDMTSYDSSEGDNETSYETISVPKMDDFDPFGFPVTI